MSGSIAGLTVTTSELAIGGALFAAAIAALRRPSAVEWRTPITAPLAAVLIVAAAAAALAPEYRVESIRVVARLCVAATLFVFVANIARDTTVAAMLTAVMLTAAAAVAVVAVLELTQHPAVLDALKAFRPGFHVVGGQMRATSTFVYPTIASMFLEIAFALGLVWIGRSRLAIVALSVVAAGIVATFTRAGLITMAMSLLIYGAIVYWRRGWLSEHVRLIALAAIVAGLVLLSRSPQLLVARMSAEGSQEWYGASYRVPQRLSLRADAFSEVPVVLTNHGRLTWQSASAPPFALSYHWLTGDTEALVSYDGLRTPFVEPVAPGKQVSMQARVRAPNYPGRYVLVWDVVQEHRTWLSLEGVLPGRTIVDVAGPAAGGPPVTYGRMPGSNMRMPRRVLWQTAARIAGDHPVLGIGPDNFRRVYGRVLGLETWDTRVHANNTYLEVLVGMGSLGALAMAWLIVVAVRAVPRILASARDDRLAIAAAATAACVAIAAHGMVDSFVTFTPAYAAFAVAAGLLFARSRSTACA